MVAIKDTEKSISVVIKEMENERDTYLKNSTPWRRINRAIKKLRKLEKIEEHKVGKWIKNPNCIATVREPFYYQCSICECPVRSNNHNYCPNCGAKMESEE